MLADRFLPVTRGHAPRREQNVRGDLLGGDAGRAAEEGGDAVRGGPSGGGEDEGRGQRAHEERELREGRRDVQQVSTLCACEFMGLSVLNDPRIFFLTKAEMRLRLNTYIFTRNTKSYVFICRNYFTISLTTFLLYSLCC